MSVVRSMAASIEQMARQREEQEEIAAERLSVAFDLRKAMEEAIEAQLRPTFGEVAYSVAIGHTPLPEGDHPQWVRDGLAALRRFDRGIGGVPAADQAES